MTLTALATLAAAPHAQAAPDYQVYALASAGGSEGVHRYSSTGTALGLFTSGFAFTGASYDFQISSAGDLYLTTEVDGVRKYSGATGAYQSFFTGGGGHRGSFFDPATGDFYLGVDVGGAINRVGPGGGANSLFVDPAGATFDVTFGPDGNVYVPNGSNIDRYTTAPVGPSQSTATGALIYRLIFGPDLTGDSQPEIFVSTNGTSINAYDVLSSPGSPGTFVATIVNSGLSVALGFGFAPDGNLYIADLGSSAVFRYSPNGTSLWTPNPSGANPGALFATLGGAADVQFVLVPEPASAAVLFAGGLLMLKRRRLSPLPS